MCFWSTRSGATVLFIVYLSVRGFQTLTLFVSNEVVRSLPIGSHIWPVRSRQFLSILHDKYSNWQSDHLNHCLKYFVFTYVSSTTGKNWWTYRTNCSSLSILLMTMIVKWYNGLLNSWILDSFQLADCLLLSFFFLVWRPVS